MNHFISICAIMKNEGKNISEWINYHKLIGIEHFYLYDNNSTDNTRDLCEAYKDIVTYKLWDYKTPCQLDAYMDCVSLYKEDSEWIAFIDIDEFIVSEIPLQNLMEDYKDYSALGVNWLIYGSSKHESRPEGNIIDNFIYRSTEDFDPNRHIKTIANPRKIKSTWNPHSFSYTDGHCVTENKELIDYPLTPTHSSKLIHINHYYCKSKEDFNAKQLRARVDIANAGYDMSDFDLHDKNDVYDPLGIDKNIRIMVLYLQYDQNRNPYTYIHIQKYLKMLKCKGSTLIINNNDKELYNYGHNNINYIQGDNTCGEFTGWDKGLQWIEENNIPCDVVIFINDACLNPGCYFNFDAVLSDEAITQCKRLNTIVGHSCNTHDGTIVNDIEIKDFMRTNCFMISKNKLDKMKTITTFDSNFIEKCINYDTSLPLFKEDAPLSKTVKDFLLEVITIKRHTPIDLKTQRPEAIRKVLGYLNEYMVTDKVRKA